MHKSNNFDTDLFYKICLFNWPFVLEGHLFVFMVKKIVGPFPGMLGSSGCALFGIQQAGISLCGIFFYLIRMPVIEKLIFCFQAKRMFLNFIENLFSKAL